MISAVVPVFNEELCLEKNLRALAAFLRDHVAGTGEEFEIVAVDDGSTDRSRAIATALAVECKVKLLENGVNLGKGATVRRGMLEADGDPTFFTDADLSTPLDQLVLFREKLAAGADVVIGTRKHAQANIGVPQNALRTWFGLGFTKLVNTTLGLDFTDYTCGFKLFRREAARAIFGRSVVNGWAFDAEILFLAKRLALNVVEVPVRWEDRPDSKVRVVRDTVRSLGELLAIRARAMAGKYGS